MRFLIESYGFQVIEAVNGLEAIECIKSQFPDLVLMDLAMPVMDGMEAARAIRKLKEGAEIPIIAARRTAGVFIKKPSKRVVTI